VFSYMHLHSTGLEKVKHHIITTDTQAEVQLHTFLTSALDGGN
jgi:hypothetical protein